MTRQLSILPLTLLALALVSPGQATAWGHRADDGGEIQAPEGGVPLPEPPSDEPAGVLSLSGQYAFGGGETLESGFGGDLRYRLWFGQVNIGLFGQGQYDLGDAWRFAGGLLGGFGRVGLEVGVAQRTATDRFASSTGLHIASYVDLGMVELGGRLTLPLVDDLAQNAAEGPMEAQGVEGAVFVRWGFDFTLHGERTRSARGHGCMPRGRHSSQHGH
jgi:hypothetical protein